MAQPIAEMFVMWRCEKCGHVTLRHHEHCDHCGEGRPPPPPDKEPSNDPLAEEPITS